MLVYTSHQMQKILFIIKHNKSFFLQQKDYNFKKGVSPSLSSSKATEDTPFFIFSADKKRYYERILYPWML